MSLLKKFFGGGDPLAAVRRAFSQERWAEALAAGEAVRSAQLEPEQASELESLLEKAGERLAAWNLQEGRAYLEVEDRSRAAEHFALARTHARSAELRAEAEEALALTRAAQPQAAAPPLALEPLFEPGCSSGCCGGPPAEPASVDPGEDLGPEAHLELLLAGFPSLLAERYIAASPRFKEAFLLGHGGETDKALACLEQIETSERDDLYYFERGSLLTRREAADAALADLERAVELNPDLEPALETLIDLEMAQGREEQARSRLSAMLDAGAAVAFCHGRLAVLEARRGDEEAALRHGLSALQEGDSSSPTASLTATLLERAGRDAEAEEVLAGLGGGCCGGISVQLAEFWLRRRRNLDKVLETMKGALREDPDNPRWPLRIAQVYLARGWSREGVQLLEKVLADPRLDPALHQEGATLLDSLRNV